MSRGVTNPRGKGLAPSLSPAFAGAGSARLGKAHRAPFRLPGSEVGLAKATCPAPALTGTSPGTHEGERKAPDGAGIVVWCYCPHWSGLGACSERRGGPMGKSKETKKEAKKKPAKTMKQKKADKKAKKEGKGGITPA